MNRKFIIGLAAGATIGAAAATALNAANEPVPKGYMVAQIDVRDTEAYQRDYATKLGPILAESGGHYLARGGRIIPLEGAVPRSRVAVIEFPSAAAAEQFYRSPAYSALAKVRQQYSTADSLIVEGVAPTP